MKERPRIFDDLAGLAGGALSMVAGFREEVEQIVQTRIDDALRRLKLARLEELDAVQEMAATARTGQMQAEARLAEIESRLALLESRLVSNV